MSKVANKFKWCKRHSDAVAHAVGEMESHGETVVTSDVADFMNVSKPTARKYLRRMANSGTLENVKKEYRKNIMRDTWRLTREAIAEYMAGHYRNNYFLYCQIVLGVIIHE